MYTVLIAEDELLVRMGIASSVPWVQMDMHVVAETADGKTALDAFYHHRPDIIITDIRMPGLDGLELIRRIRAVDSECAIIVVTNVEHESTINEARRLGVAGFLLKATMKRDDIALAVRQAKATLPEGRGTNIIVEDNHDLWREYLTNPEISAETLSLRCAQANASFFQPKGFILMHVQHNEHLSHRLFSSLVLLFSHRLEPTADFCVVDVGNDAVAISRKRFDAPTLQRSLQDLARYVHDNFDSTLNFVIQPYAPTVDALRQEVDAARHFIQDGGFFDSPAVILNPMGDPVFPELQQAVRGLHFCSLLSGQENMYSICADRVMELPRALSVSWQNGKAAGLQVLSTLGVPQDFSGMHAMVRAIAFAAEKAAEKLRLSANSSIVDSLEYIEAHIAEKISIRQVSETVGYHPNYFSNLFKREIGMSFSDFLNILRIQRAKELLKSGNLSLQEIASRCGFADLSYFSAKFKSTTGMSPSKWRTDG